MVGPVGAGDSAQDPGLDGERSGGKDPGERVLAQSLLFDGRARHRDGPLEVRVVPEQRRDRRRDRMQSGRGGVPAVPPDHRMRRRTPDGASTSEIHAGEPSGSIRRSSTRSASRTGFACRRQAASVPAGWPCSVRCRGGSVSALGRALDERQPAAAHGVGARQSGRSVSAELAQVPDELVVGGSAPVPVPVVCGVNAEVGADHKHGRHVRVVERVGGLPQSQLRSEDLGRDPTGTSSVLPDRRETPRSPRADRR